MAEVSRCLPEKLYAFLQNVTCLSNISCWKKYLCLQPEVSMFRKGVSLTLCISFIILPVSSIVPYIVPEGRVACWSSWTCLTLSKQQWGDIHITGGFLFLAACIAHILINLRALVSYQKIRSREKRIPFAGSLMLCIFVFGGTLAGRHPMSDIPALSSSMKKEQERIHGNPPYGHDLKISADSCAWIRNMSCPVSRAEA